MLVLLLALLMRQMLLDGQVIYAKGKVFGGGGGDMSDLVYLPLLQK